MDAELLTFVEHLDVPLPSAEHGLNGRLSRVLAALKGRARPALLILDTYEMAGEAERWVERQLLPNLIRESWLRVVIAGQRVPPVAGSIWEPKAAPVLELQRPRPADWLEYGRRHRPDLTLTPERVQVAWELAEGRAALLDQMFGPAA